MAVAAVAARETFRLLGDRVAALRNGLGLTQRELAARVGWSRGYIQLIEGGQRRPSPAKLRRLAAALETDYNTDLAVVAGYADPWPEGTPEPLTPEERSLVGAVRSMGPHVSVRRVEQTIRTLYRTDDELFWDASGLKDAAGNLQPE